MPTVSVLPHQDANHSQLPIHANQIAKVTLFSFHQSVAGQSGLPPSRYSFTLLWERAPRRPNLRTVAARWHEVTGIDGCVCVFQSVRHRWSCLHPYFACLINGGVHAADTSPALVAHQERRMRRGRLQSCSTAAPKPNTESTGCVAVGMVTSRPIRHI